MTTVETVPPPVRLTPTEKQILQWIADGLTYEAIGNRLDRSDEAARCRASRMYRKLGARNQAHAVHIGHQIGLLAD